MVPVRAKNAIIIALVAIIALAIIAGSVYVAVVEKNGAEEREYFFDVAPVDYNSVENSIYAKLFTDALTNYFNPIFTENDEFLNVFSRRVLRAMSLSGVSGQELGRLASALKKYALTEILGDFKLDDFSEEEFRKLMEISSTELTSEFLRGFWDESGLTGEEVGATVYNYMNEYSSEEYKSSLSSVGKDAFVKMFADVAYFLTNMDEMFEGSGNYGDPYVVKAALFELGTSFTVAARGGIEDFEKALGLRWHFDGIEGAADLNYYAVGTNGKISGILPAAGYVLREISASDIDYAQRYRMTGEEKYLILSSCGYASSVKRGTEKFLSVYGEGYGASTVSEFAAVLARSVRDLYCARFVSFGVEKSLLEEGIRIAERGSDEEIAANPIAEFFTESQKAIEKFFAGIELLSAANLTEENIDGISEEEKAVLKKNAEELWDIETEGKEVLAATVYMWSAQIFYDLQKEMN